MNPYHCKSCNKPKNQVKLESEQLRGATASELFASLNDSTVIHVAKDVQSTVAFLHFRSDTAASTFYHSNNATGLHVASIHCAISGAGTMSDPVAYNQRELLSYFMPGAAHATSRTAPTTVAPTASVAPIAAPTASVAPTAAPTASVAPTAAPTASAAPSTFSHQPARSSTRSFEEAADLLEGERAIKRARLEQINDSLNTLMLEREDVEADLQEIDRKQSLASKILHC